MSEKMRAALLQAQGGPEKVVLGEISAPEPGPFEVRLAVKFAALNHLDLWVMRGQAGPKNLPYPHVLGADAAGIVDKVGPSVTQFRVGDEVIVHPGLSCGACEKCLSGRDNLCPEYHILGEHLSGTHCEKIVVPVRNVFLKPTNITFEEAAAMPLVFTTAWHMLYRRAQIAPGSTVLIHGAGSGVTSAAIQMAKFLGAEAAVTSGSEVKLAKARELGADHLINYRSSDFLAVIKSHFPKGVDVVVDHVGESFWEKNLKALKWGGTLVTCGATSGFAANLDLRHLFFKQLSLLGSTMGSKGDFATLVRLVAEKRLRPIIDTCFPLADAQGAYQRLAKGEQFGKILIKM